MEFKLNIKMGNSAVLSSEDLSALLIVASAKIRNTGITSGTLKDINGNNVGEYAII